MNYQINTNHNNNKPHKQDQSTKQQTYNKQLQNQYINQHNQYPIYSIENSYKSTQSIKITSKLDSLQFSKWHFMVVLALGLVWIFDGYQVSLISIMSKQITQKYSQTQYKSLATAYQLGCIIGSFIFGVTAYIIGRKKVFIVTLIIYAIGIILSVFVMPFGLFFFGRFLTGISVGGQFTAIFTAIDQFLPPSVRGRVDIGIDGTWHLGGVLAALLNLIFGDFQSWRYLFGLGLIGVFALICLRRSVPQSPRWLIMRGRKQEARKIVNQIQYSVKLKRLFLVQNIQENLHNNFQQNEDRKQNNYQKKTIQEIKQEIKQQIESQEDQDRKKSVITNLQSMNNPSIGISQQETYKQGFVQDCKYYTVQIIRVILRIFKKHTKKFLLSSFLIFTQGFFFSAVYYQYPLVLKNQFGFDEKNISLYMLPLSVVSFISTLIVGVFFDTLGRKTMLLITYSGSGIILIINFLYLMKEDSILILQIGMCALFFLGSPASSSANLIASQIFPTYARTIILSLVFILGMIGGMCGVWLNYYWISSILMILAGIGGYIWCPPGQRKSLQQISQLS